MGCELLQIDAFTDRPFAGNPAAVCFLESPRDEAWMQAVAAEMNLSETAFLLPRGERHELRWFTPRVEVELCGHATLAAAHALWETGRLAEGAPARFDTRGGALGAVRRGAAIELDFPADPPREGPAPAALARALGTEPRAFGAGREYWLAELASEADVRALAPELARVAELPPLGVIATAPAAAGSAHDFVSRFFAPRAGVDEDPVTGSAHCLLGPWWGARLALQRLVGYQASRRGGTVEVELAGERVALRGQAVTVLRGWLA